MKAIKTDFDRMVNDISNLFEVIKDKRLLSLYNSFPKRYVSMREFIEGYKSNILAVDKGYIYSNNPTKLLKNSITRLVRHRFIEKRIDCRSTFFKKINLIDEFLRDLGCKDYELDNSIVSAFRKMAFGKRMPKAKDYAIVKNIVEFIYVPLLVKYGYKEVVTNETTERLNQAYQQRVEEYQKIKALYDAALNAKDLILKSVFDKIQLSLINAEQLKDDSYQEYITAFNKILNN